MIELKKCPFCGGEAYVDQSECGKHDGASVGIRFSIRCKKCHSTATGAAGYIAINLSKTGELNIWHNDLVNAAEAWNKRAKE